MHWTRSKCQQTHTLTRIETCQLRYQIRKQRRKRICCKLGFSPASTLYVFPAATLCCAVLLPSDLEDAFVMEGFRTKHTQIFTSKSLLVLVKDLDYIK